MWCSSCAWLIERVLLKRQGVRSCQASFVNDTARVRYSPRFISRQEILDQIRELGYNPQPGRSRTAEATQRDLLIRIGIACAPGMYMMMFNFVLYGGYFSKMDPGVVRFMQQLLLFLSLPIVTYCAWPIYRKAWGALRQGATTMETLITLGAGSAYLYSVYATVTGGPQVYYDTASMIITLVLVGKYLEAVARAKAVSAVGALHSVLPKKVRIRLANGDERMVTAEQVCRGDQVVVDAGGAVPVDGTVIDGVASLDESLLTGESTPVRRGPGDSVVGASLCVEGGIVVEAARTGAETTISRMAGIVRDAMASRSGSERLADRVSRFFVPAIIFIAALVLYTDLAFRHHTIQSAVMQAVSVLVVACPCALGMATPLAIAAAMGSAARRGILVRNGEVLENATRVDTVVLDKTGTLTHGRLQVVEVLTEYGAPALDGWIDGIASIESLSQHPAARAIVTWSRSHGAVLQPGVEMEILPGKGIQGAVGQHRFFVGAREMGPAVSSETAGKLDEAEAAGRTVVAAACDGQFICAFVLADMPRAGADEAVRTLQRSGIDVWLI
ncbi:MAG: cation-translocating P-type ATPase [Chloroflexi bacterium]|nr:cation-translocating P-type ATPase [Chloroflexota bacterium]